MTDIGLIYKGIKGVITMILQILNKIKYEHSKKRQLRYEKDPILTTRDKNYIIQDRKYSGWV